jgi:hypothetical protein
MQSPAAIPDASLVVKLSALNRASPAVIPALNKATVSRRQLSPNAPAVSLPG